MKPPAFRLDAVSRLRQADRDACRAELAVALSAQQRVARLRDEAQAALAELIEEKRRSLSAGAPLQWLLRQQQYEAAVRSELARRSDEVAAADEVVAVCQQRLIAAERQQQVLENLRQRGEAEQRASAARREQKQLDELTAARRSQ